MNETSTPPVFARGGETGLALPTDRVVKPVGERLLDLLRTLAREIPGISSVVVSDAQGLPISALVRGPGATAATAMSTLIRSAATNVTANMSLPRPDDITIQAGPSVVLVRCLDGGITLLVVLKEEANLGLVKLELAHHAAELQDLLDRLQ